MLKGCIQVDLLARSDGNNWTIFDNNKLVDDMAEKTAKAILQEMHGKDFSEYGFRDACIKAEMQLQNADKDRSYERSVRIR